MGNVIRMDSVPRSSLPSSYEDVRMEGFKRALWALDAVKVCNTRETLIAFENWSASGMLSEEEVDLLVKYHGWRREP